MKGSAPPASAPAVEVVSLTKTFPGQRALSDVTLQMRRGEVHGLLGENGSGKSTLIKVLSGYHLPDPGGSVRVNGVPLTFGAPAESMRLGLRFVHQNLGIIPQMTAVENVALLSGFNVRRGFPIRLREQARRTHELFSRFGVEVDLWRPLSQCRPIDRTIVAIVRALDGLDPNHGVLVLDEPTAALPPHEVQQLFEIVREVRRSGVTTVYVSHRLDEVFELVERVSILRDGIFQGTHAIEELTHTELVRLIVGLDAPHLRALTSDIESVADAVDVRDRPAQVAVTPSTTPSPGLPRLRVSGLSSRWLDGVSLEVRPGEILGVAGLLGSGREELAYALVGACRSTAEGLELDDVRVEAAMTPVRARRLGIALVPGNRQSGAAIAQFDVRENITLANLESVSRFGRVRRDAELRTAWRWIRDLDIRPQQPGRRFSQLSGGNQQKAILAKWFNIDPKVMIVDEPTAGVDVGARQAIYAEMRSRASRGLAIIVCSSDHEDLVELCDRVIILRRGHVATELSKPDIDAARLLEHTTGVPS